MGTFVGFPGQDVLVEPVETSPGMVVLPMVGKTR
jgi:hypothetical protein